MSKIKAVKTLKHISYMRPGKTKKFSSCFFLSYFNFFCLFFFCPFFDLLLKMLIAILTKNKTGQWPFFGSSHQKQNKNPLFLFKNFFEKKLLIAKLILTRLKKKPKTNINSD